MLAPDDIRGELRRLQVLVDKTAGPREREAMAYVERRLRAAVGDRLERPDAARWSQDAGPDAPRR
jgi:hypothetical protein